MKIYNLILVFLVFTNFSYKIIYDPALVTITKSTYNNETFHSINMNRKGQRIKVKYFTGANQGKTVYQRYAEWSKGKNIILFSSAGYISGVDNNITEGLTIDEGSLVNRSIEKDKFDALVIVYPPQGGGGIVVSNLSDGNLNATCKSVNTTFDIRKKSDDFEDFIDCAKDESFTVFQTHLLVFKNELKLFSNSSNVLRERRFLAVGKDQNGNIIHSIIHHPNHTTLKDGAEKVFNFLKEKKGFKDITFMINLDTGSQDVFKLFDNNGGVIASIKGTEMPERAVNLLVYYYE